MLVGNLLAAIAASIDGSFVISISSILVFLPFFFVFVLPSRNSASAEARDAHRVSQFKPCRGPDAARPGGGIRAYSPCFGATPHPVHRAASLAFGISALRRASRWGCSNPFRTILLHSYEMRRPFRRSKPLVYKSLNVPLLDSINIGIPFHDRLHNL